jgi:hypothetical protein
MSDENERSVASAGSQPVAWGNEDDDGIYAVGPTEAHAHYVWERAASGKFRHRNPRIVPLYRAPQPALTGKEREAIEKAIRRELAAEWYGGKEPDRVVALRGLLERTQ